MTEKRKIILAAVTLILTALFTQSFAADLPQKYSGNLGAGVIRIVQNPSTAFALLKSGAVSAMEIKSGRVLWTAKIAGAKDIATSGENVLVLSGSGVEILSAADGKRTGKAALPLKADAETRLAPQTVLDCLLIQSGDESILYNMKSQKVLSRTKGRVLTGTSQDAHVSPFWKSVFDETEKTAAMPDASAGEVKLIETDSGNVRWTAKVKDLEGFPTVAGEWILAQAPGAIYTLDKKSGKVVTTAKVLSKSPILPEIYFPGNDKHAYFSGTDRLIYFNPTSDKPTMDLIVPGRVDLLAGEEAFAYFLYRYTRESDKKEMSVLMGDNFSNAQLYGREPVEGTATGLFKLAGGIFAAELAPGNIHFIRKTDMKDLGSFNAGSVLAGMAAEGSVILAITTDGKLTGIDISGLK